MTGRELAETVLTGTVVTREQRQRTVIEQTYPGWRITLAGGAVRWWATRYVRPTPHQLAAGLVPSVARTTGEDLAVALATQDEIAEQIR